MKKENIIKSIFVSTLFLPLIASAVTPVPTSSVSSLGTILDSIETIMLGIGGAMAVVMFVYAGITFLIANGAPDKIAQARTAVLWGVAGVAVMIIGTVIVTIVNGLLTGGGL